MHVRKGAWRNVISVVALVSFALALQTTTGVTPANAQPATNAGFTSSIAGVGYVTPALAFNTLGTVHQVVFNCSNVAPAATVGTQPFGPGCFDVTVQGDNLSTGGTINVFNTQCAGTGNFFNEFGSSAQCGDITGATGPLCSPIANGNGTATATAFNNSTAFCEAPITAGGGAASATSTTAADCTAAVNGGTVVNGGTTCRTVPNSFNTVAASISESSPYVYGISFSGYVPALCPAPLTVGVGAGNCNPNNGANFVCPAGTTGPNAFTGTNGGGGIFACAFHITAEKKYVEITSLQLTGTGPCAVGAAASTLLFSEGLKSFFGASCTVAVTATGTVILKTGVNCANEPPLNGTPASAAASATAGFPAGSTYACSGDTLSVTIPNIGAATLNSGPIPVTVTSSGAGGVSSTLPTPTVGTSLGALCTGVSGSSVTTATGASVIVCPSGPGAGSVQACLTGSLPDTQPVICSANLGFSFLLPTQNRVVPYVRWAGEKQVLTKCFGGDGLFGGSVVEFTLEGAGTSAGATLLPASLGGAFGSTGGGEPVAAPTQNTVITTTDANGCASVIVYATSEGVVNVDAAIYSSSLTTASTAPLVNEHAFEIYYLKFDHIDLTDVNASGTTVTGTSLNLPGTTVTPVTGLGFSATPASFTLPGTIAPTANGFAIPLCGFDYVRAMVHGYFELPGDPSGRPATTVSIPNAPNGASTSYVLPAGRWVLPEDWPVLATFAGFTSSGSPVDTTPASVFQWDLNSGYVFNPGSENPALCFGPANTAAAGIATNVSGAINNSGVGGQVSYGPCYGEDAAGTIYNTAPGFAAPAANDCSTGVTVGIGPFDITQTCTTPGPLTYSPTGGSILTAGATPGSFNFSVLSTNSTYLPNGTLNEYDAPMPPAQISFQISGPGFLNEVNKTGFYHINTVDANGNVNGAIYPDPFYAEAIPASPIIPPVTNNGGYLWDTFGFRGGVTLGPTTSAGFVAGESTTAPSFAADPCAENTVTANGGPPQGFTFVAGSVQGAVGNCFVGVAGVPDKLVTLAECNALNGTFTVITPSAPFPGTPAEGTCEIKPAPATAAGGINISNFGPGCPAFGGQTQIPSSATSVEVANGSGFVVGETVQVYSTADGHTIASGLTLTGVTAGPDTATYPNSATLTFGNVPAGLCVAIFQGIFTAEQIAVSVPSTNAALASLANGANVGVATPGAGGASGTTTTTTVSSTTACASPIAPAGDTVFCLSNANALATALGNCVLSRGPIGGPVAFGTCEPATFLPAGTFLQAAPAVGTVPIRDANPLFPGNSTVSTAGQGPYPFWQWVPNPSTANTFPNNATVYSDNHGEAVVSIDTGVTFEQPAVAGVCPTNYTLATTPDGTQECLLNLAALGTAANTLTGVAFQNLAAANAFSAAAPGCIQTNANGTSGPVVAPTAAATTTGTPTTALGTGVSPATGPAAGQICINNLGGIEFGAGATLGTTTVQAIADYPYTRGLHPAISSGPINKVFTSMFNKSVSVTPTSGLGGPAGTTSYVVTITGTNICGQPILGEPVDVYAISGSSGAVVLAPLGPGVPNGSNSSRVFLSTGAGAFNGITAGTASLSLEVLNSALGNGGLVIKAVFPLERIERFVTVIPGTTAPTTTQQLYPPGYNMVGGPPGTNFGVAEQVFTFSPATNTYSPITGTNVSSAPPTCTGYFAYFASAASVTINVTSKAGDTATCSLQAGYNLVGNPFGSNALLPAGVTAYHFNGTGYDIVSAIPVGGAVFIYEAAPTTITLTAT